MESTKYRVEPVAVPRLFVFILLFALIFQPLTPAFAQEIPAETSQQEAPTPAEDQEGQQERVQQEAESPEPSSQSNVAKKLLPADVTDEAVQKDNANMSPAALSTDQEAVDHFRNNLEFTKFAQVDESSGSFQFEIPLTLPPGRNGMQPNLSLKYSSKPTTEGSIVGYGWSFSIPYIERLNKRGLDRMYSDNFYSSTISGELSEIGGGTYAAKVETGDFLSYTFANNVWTVTDKRGTVYTFGAADDSRMSNPADVSSVAKWMLSEVRDTNGNYVRYEYTKDSGQIYPYKILYTGNGATDGIFEVDFTRTDNADYAESSSLGFLVKTRFRITKIAAKTNGVIVHTYALSYSTPINRTRALLASITESGADESTAMTTTLPPYTFRYQDSDNPGWDDVSTRWELPEPFVDFYERWAGTLFLELNGDGLPDVIRSYRLSSDGVDIRKAYLHNGAGWTLDTSGTWDVPGYFSDNGRDAGYRVADVNGDGLDDILQSIGTSRTALINTETGWVASSTWNPPVMFTTEVGQDNGARVVDLNGDGLPDISWANNQDAFDYTYLNTGSGWATTTWSLPPMDFVTLQYRDNGLIHVDANGDGLPDLIRAVGDGVSEFIQQYLHSGGSGWITSSSLPGLGTEEVFIANSKDLGYRMVDLNGDGLTDILRGMAVDGGGVATAAYINQGASWINLASDWPTPIPFIQQTAWADYWGARFGDFNGDGLVDVISKNPSSGITYAHQNTSTKVDLLSAIIYPTGGSTSVEYKTAQQYKDGSNIVLNPKMPYSVFTVSKLVHSDGAGTSGASTYTYQDGSFYFTSPFNRKFAGFGVVVKADPEGNVTKTYFHQGNNTNTSGGEYDDHIAKAGKVYRIEQYDNAAKLYQLTVNKWDRSNLGVDRDFVKLARTTTLDYDGNATHADAATEYTYDNASGNVLSKTEWGVVVGNTNGSFTDSGADKRITTYDYAVGSTTKVNLPKIMTLTNSSGSKVAEQKFYYDALAYGSVGKGNQTKVEQWKSGTSYINTQKTYNAFGLPATATDPRGKVTRYAYDTYNLYPATVTDPLNRVTRYTYDYSSGQVVQKTDQNNLVYETFYDGIDRVLQRKQPNLTNPTALVVVQFYQYVDTAGAKRVTRFDYLSGSMGLPTYQYFDGFNRLIQERSPSELGFNVRDIGYSRLGLVQKESLPYAGTGTTKTAPTTNAKLYASYTYDPLQRVIAMANALGTTTVAFDDWAATTTDANGKKKGIVKDAYDNLIRVNEVNGASTYTTKYDWDLNGNLTKITDALGNIRNFTYDGLGRRLTAQDLHTPADTTYGTWTYTYDDAGNITRTVDPRNQTVNSSYDDLNRITNEDFAGTVAKDALYTYDACTYGIGKVCSIVMSPSATTTYAYNAIGGVATEQRNIVGTVHTTTYGYDWLGNVTLITHPDSSQTRNTYNGAGLLDKIETKKPGGAFAPIVSNLNYSPRNQIATIAYANGLTTTNTYNANLLYLLSTKRTVNVAGQKLQDMTYTYDKVGNIKRIVDISTTGTAKTVDYTYDDLYRLTVASSTNATSSPNYKITYAYNALGDITSASDRGTYTYGGIQYANPHAPTKIGTMTISYDNNGNATSTGAWNYVWDYRNRLYTSTSGTATIAYRYDHQNSRVYYSDGSATLEYPNRYSLKNMTSGTSTINIFAGELLLATLENRGTANIITYVQPDHLGSTQVTTNASGAPVEMIDYYPYGAAKIDQGPSTARKYIGQYFDAKNSLSYLNARYYEGSRGQFLSQDPVFWEVGQTADGRAALSNPQAMNSYSYALDNPIINKDPNGRWFQEFITGQQSWPSFQIELGDASNQLAQDSSAWAYAFDHPYTTGGAVGVGAGVAAYGVSATLTSMSVDALAGVGTRSMGNLSRLESLPRVSSVPGKLENLSRITGKSAQQLLQEASQSGKPYIDFRNGGNINIFNQGASQNTLTRITTNPQITRIISAGTTQLRSLSNNLSSGGMQSLQSTLSGLSKVLSQISTALKSLK